MKIFGIIIEANPLHTGHTYFINEIKKKYNPDIIVAITSTSFTMRGEISLLDKFTKTKLYLNNNIDIILELPFNLAVQSAEYFARNACLILSKIGVTDIVFGSETTNIDLYYKYLNFLNNTTIKNKTISKKQQILTSIKNSNFTTEEINIISMPNFTLGSMYIKTIKDYNLNIIPHLIKRIDNNYHDKISTKNIASATTIRNYLKNNEDINKYLPYNSDYLIDINKAEKIIFNLIKYQFLAKDNNTEFTKKEGIINYIKNNGVFDKSLNELQNSLKNKKYSISLINRAILHNLIETTGYDFIEYIRLLGANKKGFSYINTLDKQTKAIIFSNPNELLNKDKPIKIQNLLNYELKATILYQIITNNNELYKNEFKLPIRKDD